ncbi:methyltransferase domain-containing protein [Wenzhouxiangella sp. XN201]|uniref:methyltransferase domain-containing protein n=1 Tax=Wenzhouxiangella sp. XN201 TaxID=2710755 RepID=UPI0013C998D7|nr:methyltransferase domain-containing protein [Wenzhouxiangella sp. XN201]NEZ02812.1 methyltransferase domain-containing protein [Wenzhouxiangella sp. XN201]
MNEGADQAALRRRFDAIAETFDEHAALVREVGSRLLERLDGLRFSPRQIADLGCGTGHQTLALHERFSELPILALDQSRGMLAQARRRRGRWRPKYALVEADFHTLPLAEASVDLVHACLSLQWSDRLEATLRGLRRIMRPGGLVLVALNGPDTLTELSQTGAVIDCGNACHAQELGDRLTRAGFQEPVLDTDWLTLSYSHIGDLLADLDHLGIGYSLPDDPESLESQLPRNAEGALIVTWEVVYASAWSPDEGQPIRTERGEEASVSISSLGIRRRPGD